MGRPSPTPVTTDGNLNPPPPKIRSFLAKFVQLEQRCRRGISYEKCTAFSKACLRLLFAVFATNNQNPPMLAHGLPAEAPINGTTDQMQAGPENLSSSPVLDYLKQLHAEYAPLTEGRVATYIPELAKANPESF